MFAHPLPSFLLDAVKTVEQVVDTVDQVTEFLGNLGAALTSRNNLVLENLALRQQLAAYQRQKAKPTIREADRVVLAALSRLWDGWKDAIFIVQPDTVVKWWDRLKRFWLRLQAKLRAKPKGRPRTLKETIEAIREMSRLNPDWGAPRIRRELKLKLGIRVAESTVSKYMIRNPKPPSKTWRSFLENHAQEIWSIDFLVQHTVFMKPVYVFTVKHHGTRKVVHINATEHPTLDWVKQQIREALWDNEKPKFTLHDNDAIFGNYPNPVKVNGKSYRNHLDRWLKETMGIQGVRTPYGAPKANAISERFNGTLRRECLDHFLFFNVGHIQRVCREFQIYFNEHRTHKTLDDIPDPKPESGYVTAKPKNGKLIAIPHLNGLVYDFRWAA